MKNRGFLVSILILFILLIGLSACWRSAANRPDQMTQTGLKDIEWAADTWSKVAESSSAGLADQGSAGLDSGSAQTTQSAGLPDDESSDCETTLTVTETVAVETTATMAAATCTATTTATKTTAATTKVTRATTKATTVAEARPAATTAPTMAATTAATTAKPSDLTAGQWIAEIFRLTNEVRTANGLPPFRSPDAALAGAAATRGGELAAVYSHTRPNGESCFTVLAEYDVAWSCAAENIAAASAGYYTPADMVNGWMGSDGHRKNILNPDLTTMGVGYGEGNGNEYFVQLFIG